MTQTERHERRRDDIAWAILSGLIARGEVLADPFGRLLEGEIDLSNLSIPAETQKRLLAATAMSVGLANDLARYVGPPPRPGRREPTNGRSWHPCLDMDGVVKVAHRPDGGQVIVEVWTTPDFYRSPDAVALQRTVEDWLVQECGLPISNVQWWRADSGEGPRPRP